MWRCCWPPRENRRCAYGKRGDGTGVSLTSTLQALQVHRHRSKKQGKRPRLRRKVSTRSAIASQSRPQASKGCSFALLLQANPVLGHQQSHSACGPAELHLNLATESSTLNCGSSSHQGVCVLNRARWYAMDLIVPTSGQPSSVSSTHLAKGQQWMLTLSRTRRPLTNMTCAQVWRATSHKRGTMATTDCNVHTVSQCPHLFTRTFDAAARRS